MTDTSNNQLIVRPQTQPALRQGTLALVAKDACRREVQAEATLMFGGAFGGMAGIMMLIGGATTALPLVAVGGVAVLAGVVATNIVLHRKAHQSKRVYIDRRDQLMKALLPMLNEAAKTGNLKKGMELLVGASEQEQAIVAVHHTEPRELHSAPGKSEPALFVRGFLYEPKQQENGTIVRGDMLGYEPYFEQVVALPPASRGKSVTTRQKTSPKIANLTPHPA